MAKKKRQLKPNAGDTAAQALEGKPDTPPAQEAEQKPKTGQDQLEREVAPGPTKEQLLTFLMYATGLFDDTP